MAFLDFLFPKFCVNCRKFGSYLCSHCFARVTFTDTGFCSVCQRPAIGGLTHPRCKNKFTIDGIFSSLVYMGVVKKLVYQFKYPPYIKDLKDLLGDFFYEGLLEKEFFYKQLQSEAVFVPIPLFAGKLRKRGYNQAKLLAEGLGEKFGIPVWDALERVKNTKTQIGLTQQARQENIKDAFALRGEFREKLQEVKQVFLIDDVTTSGATLKEAAKVLKSSGVAHVWGLTLAHGN